MAVHVLGIMVGVTQYRVMGRMRSNMLRRMLGIILAFFALVLFLKAAGVLSW